jgi:hypothetical protein
MGGNVQIIKNNNIIKAEKIPIKDIGLRKFQNDFKEMFKKLNKLFYNKYKKYLWENEEILNNGFVFNGSTSFLMDISNLDKEEELKKLKPFAGDIDITVPQEYKKELFDLLKDLEDKWITNKIQYLGNNKTESSIGEQINSLFKYCYKKDICVNSQVDFEFVKYEDNIPGEFEKFGHSSTLTDLREGIKAVFHKYLLRSISYALSKFNDNVIFVSSSANCDNWEKKISKSKKERHLIKFSITKGLRFAYEPLICDGKQVEKDGKLVYRELKTDESIYNTNIKDIFEILFGVKPSKNEEVDFWSFVGLVKLIKKYLNKKQQKDVLNRFLELLWDCKENKNIAQELERDNTELDYQIKNAAVSYLIKQLKLAIPKEWENKMKCYYDNYGKGRKIKSAIKQVRENKKSLKENFVTDLYKFLKEKDVEPSLIQKIISVVKDKSLDKEIQEIVNRIDSGNKDIFDIIKVNLSKMKMSVFDKIKFLKMMKKNSLKTFEGENLIDLLEQNDLLTKNHKTIDTFLDNIYNARFKVRGQGTTSSGKGELFLALFGNGKVGQGKGDVLINNKGYEVKGINGIIVPTGTWLFDNIDPTKEFPNYIFDKDKNGFKKYLKTLNEKDIQKVLKKLFIQRVNKIYRPKMEEIYNKYLSNVKTAKDFNNVFQDYINAVGEYMLDEYKKAEKFDYVWISNGKKSKLIDKNPLEKINFKMVGFFTNGKNNKPTITIGEIL